MRAVIYFHWRDHKKNHEVREFISRILCIVLRFQTGAPTDTIARRIRVKQVGWDDGARRIRRSSGSCSRGRERLDWEKKSSGYSENPAALTGGATARLKR